MLSTSCQKAVGFDSEVVKKHPKLSKFRPADAMGTLYFNMAVLRSRVVG